MALDAPLENLKVMFSVTITCCCLSSLYYCNWMICTPLPDLSSNCSFTKNNPLYRFSRSLLERNFRGLQNYFVMYLTSGDAANNPLRVRPAVQTIFGLAAAAVARQLCQQAAAAPPVLQATPPVPASSKAPFADLDCDLNHYCTCLPLSNPFE